MPSFTKTNFSGGINQFLDDSKIDAETQQWLLINGRTRRGSIDAIYLPLDITGTLPVEGGNMQGLYAVGNYLVVFIDGKAYYSARDPIVWQQIASFQMSATAPRLYIALVPASSVNNVRKLRNTDDIQEGVDIGSESIAPSPRAAIVMDGETQPWLIFPDLTCRVTKGFAAWTQADPEYVPIGTLPMWHPDGILYCVTKDSRGEATQIVHSVSGQPINFVVVVDTNGNKSATETEGGANATAHHVDYDAVTCMRLISASQGAFYASTLKNCYLVIPDYQTLLFGEPTFGTQFLFSAGALQQDAVVDVLGDSALISYRGVRSFNGVSELQNQGRNDPFSMPINDIVADITQTVVSCTSFDNYAVFSLTTKHGPGLLWYDTMQKVWASLDLYQNVGLVQQFATIQTAEALELFFYTADNRLYKAFASESVAATGVYVGAVTPSNGAKSVHRITSVKAVFDNIRTSGYAQCFVMAGKVKSDSQVHVLTQSYPAVSDYESVPFNTQASEGATVARFDFSDCTQLANKASLMLEWDARAKLLSVQFETAEVANTSDEKTYAGISTLIQPDRVIFIGDDGWDTETRREVRESMLSIKDVDLYVGCGDHSYVESDPENAFFKYWRSLHQAGKFIAVPGNHDQDSDNCRTFREFMRMQPSRYFRYGNLQYLDLFMFNTGLKTNDTQIEPDNVDQAQFINCRQPVWLRNSLASSTKPHRVVVMHHPPYTSGTSHYPGSTLFRQLPYKSWGASAVVSGHTHALERCQKDGMSYFVTGGGGSNLVLENATVLPETKVYQAIYGFLLVRAFPLTLEFNFINSSTKEVIDQWLVRKVQ